MSKEIINFISNNWLLILIAIISLVPIIPQKMVDPFGHEMNKRMNPPFPDKPFSLLKFICRGIFEAFAEFAINIGLRGSATVLMFIVVMFDLINKKTLSSEAVVIIVIAVISLYMEYLINNAEEIEFFRIFKYKRKKESGPSLPTPSN